MLLPMTLPDLDRRARQLDNDVRAIYGMLDGISKVQKQHSERLDEFASRQDEFASRQDQFASRQDEFAARQDQFAARQDEFAARQDQFTARQDQFAARQDQFTAEQATHREKLDEILALLRNGHPAGSG
jgi:uncharacterized coiled-coil DUF342 family protein